MTYNVEIEQAAKVIKDATALLFTSGAGLGVDSGLPDFRGPEGFWKAYPPMKKLGLQFPMMSNPEWFAKDPEFAWGFWGHRYHLYKNATPHFGFEVMKRLGESKLDKEGYFVYTSNVDGAFQKAGFPEERILECHGSVHWMQCVDQCTEKIWSNEGLSVEVDESTFRAAAPLPKCEECSSLARPNVLMFGDYGWISGRYSKQRNSYRHWLKALAPTTKLVIIEIGAGLAVPTVRLEGESKAVDRDGTLIRINLRDTNAPEGSVVIPLGGKEALTRIEQAFLRS